MLESMQHILINVSIRWECGSAHTFHVQTSLYWQHLEIVDMYHSRHLVSTDTSMAVMEQCIDKDRGWSVKGISHHTRSFGSTVLGISGQDLQLRKFTSKWVPHHLNQVVKR